MSQINERVAVVKQFNMADTALLITRYLTDAGVGEVLDSMPIQKPTQATRTHRIARIARAAWPDMWAPHLT